jgi:hypothetical protein
MHIMTEEELQADTLVMGAAGGSPFDPDEPEDFQHPDVLEAYPPIRPNTHPHRNRFLILYLLCCGPHIHSNIHL